jgi:hypothetical protein
MDNLDDKQWGIVTGWMKRGRDLQEEDSYASFISLWIAFNAYCCAKYAKDAHGLMPNLNKRQGLSEITDQCDIHGTTDVDGVGEIYRLKINEPGNITIVISERYMENRIFDKFAKVHKRKYVELLADPGFRQKVEDFRDAISGDSYNPRPFPYVINMAKAQDLWEYEPVKDFDTLKGKHIIASFENIKNLLELKNVLYQVRCNIFHGEKQPGEPNDDRIVKHAAPVLEGILKHLIMVSAPEWVLNR